MEAREFIKVAAILAMRSKPTAQPITRSEFLGQWSHSLHHAAAEVWDEVLKAQATKTPDNIVQAQRAIGKMGAVHTGKIDTTSTGSRLHRYIFEGDPLILEIASDNSFQVYRPVVVEE